MYYSGLRLGFYRLWCYVESVEPTITVDNPDLPNDRAALWRQELELIAQSLATIRATVKSNALLSEESRGDAVEHLVHAENSILRALFTHARHARNLAALPSED